MGTREVDVLVYAHGLLDVCKPAPRNPPEDLIVEDPFRLGQVADNSGRALVLIVPLFDWNGPNLLGSPAHLNALVAEAQEHLAGLLGAPPAVSNLILAGHSRAHSFLDAVAQKYADAQMERGALASLSEVWMFDTTYQCDIPAWMALLGNKPGLDVKVFYLKGGPTAPSAEALGRRALKSGGRLTVTALTGIHHCDVPGRQLPGLLANRPAHELDFDQPHTSLRERIIATAEDQWQKWKQGTVDETSAAATPLLTRYWAVVGEQVRPDQLQSGAWQSQHPWSAAFVSYVMREAGAGDSFKYAAYHTGYIAAAKRAAAYGNASKFQAFPIGQAPLEAGDVVCHDRPDPPNGPCSGTTFENAGSKGHMISHGEIVLEIDAARGYAITIGGNTGQQYPRIRGALGGNTVGKRQIAIDHRGFCIASQGQCPYFAVLKPPHEMAAPDREYDISPDALQESRAVRITVIGHASARWRGAKGQAAANRLNDALSLQRAENVRGLVEQILRQELPGVPILPGTSGAPGQQPSGLQVGSYGVGSRQPVVPSQNPRENDPRNRSVQVLIELVTTKDGVTGASRAPRRISALSDSWYGKVTSVKGHDHRRRGHRRSRLPRGNDDP